VAQHYGVSVINMVMSAEYAAAGDGSWQKRVWRTFDYSVFYKGGRHPLWYIHAYLADIVVYTLRQSIIGMAGCGVNNENTMPQLVPWPDTPLATVAELSSVLSCSSTSNIYDANPLFGHDGSNAVGVTGARTEPIPGVESHDWPLYQDRPDKAGKSIHRAGNWRTWPRGVLVRFIYLSVHPPSRYP
jgi:hypothetical protein